MNDETRVPRPGTWEESVFHALRSTKDGSVHLSVLYGLVKQVREKAGLPLNPTWECTVRRTLQQSSLFCQEKRGSGIWSLTAKEERVMAV